eukprot:6188910-Pleurochrysis_carterae.AAC.1
MHASFLLLLAPSPSPPDPLSQPHPEPRAFPHHFSSHSHPSCPLASPLRLLSPHLSSYPSLSPRFFRRLVPPPLSPSSHTCLEGLECARARLNICVSNVGLVRASSHLHKAIQKVYGARKQGLPCSFEGLPSAAVAAPSAGAPARQLRQRLAYAACGWSKGTLLPAD